MVLFFLTVNEERRGEHGKADEGGRSRSALSRPTGSISIILDFNIESYSMPNGVLYLRVASCIATQVEGLRTLRQNIFTELQQVALTQQSQQFASAASAGESFVKRFAELELRAEKDLNNYTRKRIRVCYLLAFSSPPLSSPPLTSPLLLCSL